MKKLIFVPTPLAEESPLSMIKRATRCHGFSTTGKLNGLCIGRETFRSIALTQNSDFAKLFAAEAGSHGPRVLNGFYATIQRPKQRQCFVIADIQIPTTFLRLRTGAYCDGCFHQGWERQVRDLKFAEYCPYHFKKYLTQCPECHGPFEWWHAIDGKCKWCGKTLKCQSCTPDECLLEQKLVALMRLRDHLGFDRLLTLTRRLGYTPEKPTIPDAMRRVIFMGALSIMTDDFGVILNHLLDLHSMHPDVEKVWIAARLSLVDTLAAHAASKIFLQTELKHPSIPELIPTPFLLTLRQLRTALNISTGQMTKIKKLTPLAHKNRYSCFTSDEAATLAKKANDFLLTDDGRLPIPQKDMWTKTATCHKLGISPGTLKLYIQHGLLKPYLGSRHTQFFIPSEIEDFSTLYTPLPNLSRRLGMSARRLRAMLDSLEVKIVPDHNLRDRHWLIKNMDLYRITTAIKGKTKKPRHCLLLPSADFKKKPATAYNTVRETAKALQIAADNVTSAVRKNMLKGACRGKKMRILIPKSEIQKFQKKFLTTVQAAAILKVHYPKASDLLFGLGVRAVTGPMVDGTRDNIYKAVDIHRVAAIAEMEPPNEHFNYCSKTATAKRLNLSPDTLSKLVAIGIIKHIKGRNGVYFRPSWLKEFTDAYILPSELLNLAGLPPIMAPQMIDVLKSIGITPITYKINDQLLHLYDRALLQDSDNELMKKLAYLNRSRKYRAYLKLTTKTPPHGYTPLKDLTKTYNISVADLSNLFIKYGYISTITINRVRYISSTDRKKCEHILDNYCTCTMASKIISGEYNKITILLYSGILKSEHPIPENLTKTKLISRKNLKTYLDIHRPPPKAN
ncbi:hypothetical protein [Pseudomonas chlororaphis]|uniref:hypothetical protein n=1 Tax=Pseudomonas chlororaphis TaxID=587753 RepID=UPI001928DA15|nr:hypothetical protein [Pseudomonas chlororaphis]QQX57100.1 hypothetical protein JHW28_21305 [Pseudomonas chlororaphis subsp. aurantiaca]